MLAALIELPSAFRADVCLVEWPERLGTQLVSADSPPLVQATSRVVDIVYWEDGASRYLVTLTENSMFTPFLTVLDVQRSYREVACVPLPDTRMPTCMTVMTDPHGKSYFLVGQRDGGCASYEAPAAAKVAAREAKRRHLDAIAPLEVAGEAAASHCAW